MITGSNFAARAAALAEYEAHSAAELSAETARLDAERQAARDARARNVAEARSMASATALSLEIEIATEVRSELAALARDFAENPRPAAAKIATFWRAAHARCLEQLGAPLDFNHLAAALAAAHGLEARVAGKDYYVFNGSNKAADLTAITAAHLVVSPDAPNVIEGQMVYTAAVPIVVEGRLRELEYVIAKDVPARPADAERSVVMLSRATVGARTAACAELDERRAAAERAANMATAGASMAEKEARDRAEESRARTSWKTNEIAPKPQPFNGQVSVEVHPEPLRGVEVHPQHFAPSNGRPS